MDAVVKGYTFAAENPGESADILLNTRPSWMPGLVKASQNTIAAVYRRRETSAYRRPVWERYTVAV